MTQKQEHKHSHGELVAGTDIIGSHRPDQQFRVKTYDFKRPDKFSKEQIRTLAIMHETMAALLQTKLAASLRVDVKLHVNCVDQMTYGEFMNSIPSPSLLGCVEFDHRGAMLIQMDGTLISGITERLYGGEFPENPVAAPVTDLEKTFFRNMFTQNHGILEILAEGWKQIVDPDPQLGGFETVKEFAQIVPPTEMIVLTSFKVVIQGGEHYINFVYPYISIEPHIYKLSAAYWYSTIRGKTSNNDPGYISTVTSLPVSMHLICPHPGITPKQLNQLSEGSKIPLTTWDGKSFKLVGSGKAFLDLESSGDRETLRIINPEKSLVEKELFQTKIHDTKSNSNELIIREISQFGTEVKETLKVFGKEIQDLREHQEEFMDQLYLSSSRDFSPAAPPTKNLNRPFQEISEADLENLFIILKREHPQLAALVFTYMETPLAARLLELFPGNKQVVIIERIGKIEAISPAVISEVTKYITEKCAQMAIQRLDEGGYGRIVDILNLVTRGTEKHVIETLEKNDAAFAEEIKKRMFVFEDIILLDDKAIRKTVERCERRDLVLAVKAVEEVVRQRIRSVLTEEENQRLNSDMEELGRVRLKEVEDAQQRIVNVIRVLEQEGYIIIARQDELLP